ncbi:MAG: hypothetical protein GDA44_05595, partial [Prochloron sp. SP5CPC1]|nr:hypothetical protein [Candidatus Paraprochloron terpiosi SP5CPC1]
MIKSNNFSSLKTALIYSAVFTTLTLGVTQTPAHSQILPQVWVSGGVKDGDISYGIGARLVDFGVEVGTGEDGSTGVDLLAFQNFGVVSPYLGIG